LQLTVTVNNGNAASSQPPTPPLGTVPENKFQSVSTPEQKLLA